MQVVYRNGSLDHSFRSLYTVEYITNKKDYETLYAGTHPAPWELYKTREFSELDSALEFYLAHYFDEKTYEVRFFEQIFFDNETVKESYIDSHFDSSFMTIVSSEINNNREKKMKKLQEQIEMQNEENEMLMSFVESINGKKEFAEFKREYYKK